MQKWGNYELTVRGLPNCFPVFGSQQRSSPVLLPLTRCLPSGDHAMHRTQFLCPETLKTQDKIVKKHTEENHFSSYSPTITGLKTLEKLRFTKYNHV